MTMMQLTLRLVLLMGASVTLSTSFVSRVTKQHPPASITASYALSERQMQFWEDVDKGLDDIEAFFAKKGQDIDRIRQFTKRCVRVERKVLFFVWNRTRITVRRTCTHFFLPPQCFRPKSSSSGCWSRPRAFRRACRRSYI
jgi:hypothetical protein